MTSLNQRKYRGINTNTHTPYYNHPGNDGGQCLADASLHKTEYFLCLRAIPAEVLQEEVVQYPKALYRKAKQLF